MPVHSTLTGTSFIASAPGFRHLLSLSPRVRLLLAFSGLLAFLVKFLRAKDTKRTTKGGCYLEDLNKVSLAAAGTPLISRRHRWVVIMRAKMHGKLTILSSLEEVGCTKGSNQQRGPDRLNRDIWMCPRSKIEWGSQYSRLTAWSGREVSDFI